VLHSAHPHSALHQAFNQAAHHRSTDSRSTDIRSMDSCGQLLSSKSTAAATTVEGLLAQTAVVTIRGYQV
jgi:hypothetical protein